MSPKGSNIPSRMSWIKIADPVAHTLYRCNARQRSASWTQGDSVTARFKTAPLKDDEGTRTHEDLGAQFFVGLPVHEYRDTMTLKNRLAEK